MKNIVSPISARQAGRLAKVLEEHGIGVRKVQAFLIENASGLVEWIDHQIANPEFLYPVAIHYKTDIDAILEHLFSESFSWLTQHYNPKSKDLIKVDMALLCYHEDNIGLERLMADCKRLKARPATFHGLIFFAKSYPELVKSGLFLAAGTLLERCNETIIPAINDNMLFTCHFGPYDKWTFGPHCCFLIERDSV